MSEIGRVVNAQRFTQGLTVEDYLSSIGDNKSRFEPHINAFKLSPADARYFGDVVKSLGAVKVVGIGEDWCPDVHRGLPIVARIAEASGMELRFFLRDKNVDLMNLFLKEGKYQSIPVFAFFDRGFQPPGPLDRAAGSGHQIPGPDPGGTGTVETERGRYPKGDARKDGAADGELAAGDGEGTQGTAVAVGHGAALSRILA